MCWRNWNCMAHVEIGWIFEIYQTVLNLYCTTLLDLTSKKCCCVPQGSVLWPILFNIYGNDILHLSDHFKFLLFADGVNILYPSRIVFLENTVNNELVKVNQWLCINRLSINLYETNFVVFSKIKSSNNLNSQLTLA